jgi:transposase
MPVDIRAGVDRLSLYVQQVLGRAPCDGTAYVFSNRRHTRLKVVCWDGNGVWMCVRRLHRGQFVWPQRGRRQLAAHHRAMTMAGSRRGLAAPVGAVAGGLAIVSPLLTAPSFC